MSSQYNNLIIALPLIIMLLTSSLIIGGEHPVIDDSASLVQDEMLSLQKSTEISSIEIVRREIY